MRPAPQLGHDPVVLYPVDRRPNHDEVERAREVNVLRSPLNPVNVSPTSWLPSPRLVQHELRGIDRDDLLEPRREGYRQLTRSAAKVEKPAPPRCKLRKAFVQLGRIRRTTGVAPNDIWVVELLPCPNARS